MEPAASVSDGEAPETKRQRFGEKKRYHCTFAGCHRDYSRAEHLYRHQLNHNPKEIFRCKVPGCDRNFVRQDLCNRHQERHFARVKQEETSADLKNSSISSAPDEISAIVASVSSLRHTRSPTRDDTTFLSPRSRGSTENDGGSNTGPAGPTCITSAGAQAQASTITTLSAPLNQPFMTSPHPTVAVPSAFGTGQPVSDQRNTRIPAASYDIQRRMTDSSLNTRFPATNMGNVTFHDSPLSVRDEFASWLFDDYSALPMTTPGGLGFVGSSDGFGSQIYPNFFDDADFESMFPLASPQSVAGPGSNFSAASTSDLPFSQYKRQEILTFMDTRFIEDDTSDLMQLKEELYHGDRDYDGHPLSLVSMHSYVKSYWSHFNDQLPLLHKPTFSPDETHPQLLLAIMVVGASHLTCPTSDVAHKFALFVAWHLRWQVVKGADSRPPAKLWVFQTLLLLEVFEKMGCSRTLHERSNIHSPTTITLMRRGTALIDDPRDHDSHKSASPEKWWRRWIQSEATRRAAFAAFLLDTYCATIFGHSAVMSVHEIHLPLPCDDALWSATSAAEVGRVEASLHANGVKPLTFTEAIKKILTGRNVRTNTFGRTILMAGLLSVTWHMQQRDLQMNILGMSRGMGSLPNNWKEPLSKSFDFWKKEFDEGLAHMQLASLPWQQHRHQAMENDIRDAADVLHHLSHMALQIDFRDYQIMAGAKIVAARPVTDAHRAASRARVSAWIRSPSGRTAIFHSLQCLRAALIRTSDQGQHRYNARDDHLLLRPWALYIAGLIVFSWGFSADGLLRPFPAHLLHSPRSPTVLSGEWQSTDQIRNAVFQDAQLYLQTIGAVASAQELERIKAGRNNVVGLLRTLEFAFQESKWELLQEAASRLQGAIRLLQQ